MISEIAKKAIFEIEKNGAVRLEKIAIDLSPERPDMAVDYKLNADQLEKIIVQAISEATENLRSENERLKKLCRNADKLLSKVRAFQHLNLEESWLDELEKAGGE